MDEIEFYATPGYGEMFLAQRNYSQAVRVGNRIEISGQGGWDDDLQFPEDLDTEIAQAFDNVERTLAAAGASWRHVIAVNSYHVPVATEEIGAPHTDAMVGQFRQRLGDRTPIWTMTGVPLLAAPKMRVEIRVTAILG